MKWIPYPFIRIVFFFVIGILFAIFFPDVVTALVAQVVLVILIIIFFVMVIMQWHRNTNWPGITGLIIIFIAGFLYLHHRTAARHPDSILSATFPIEFYTGQIQKPLEEKDHSWKAEVEIEFIRSDSHWQKASGKLLAYFIRSDSIIPYQYGDVIIIKGSPAEVKPPANPGEFDYRQYLRYKNIYHQQVIKQSDVTLLSHKTMSWHKTFAFEVRHWANGVLHQYVSGKQQQAIASALILGVTDDLDADIYGAYASAGVMHILAVSGLHVGIVYLVVFFLLTPCNKLKGGKWLVAFICVAVLWAYAFITGLSPSVLRAVIMFTFMAMAKPLHHKPNIYNTLAASAFFILIINPFYIMSVGFQLSYLAVLGIVSLQPPLYNLWEPRSRVLDFVWKASAVSIAAQISTFALALLYFHQFPNYFLVFNLFVGILSSIVLVTGLVLLSVSFSASLSVFVGIILTWFIKLMNTIIFTVNALPFNRINHIYITPFQCVIIMGGCVSIILLLKVKQFRYLIITVIFVGGYSVTQWFHYIHEVRPAGITVYHVPKHAAMDLFDDGKVYDMHDSTLCHEHTIDKYVNSNRFMHGVVSVNDGTDIGIVTNLSGARLIFWKGRYILNITTKKFRPLPLPPLEYVIISNNAVSDLTTLTQQLNFRKLIIDSSNSFYFAEGLRHHALALELDFHSVWHGGAFCSTL